MKFSILPAVDDAGGGLFGTTGYPSSGRYPVLQKDTYLPRYLGRYVRSVGSLQKTVGHAVHRRADKACQGSEVPQLSVDGRTGPHGRGHTGLNEMEWAIPTRSPDDPGPREDLPAQSRLLTYTVLCTVPCTALQQCFDTRMQGQLAAAGCQLKLKLRPRVSAPNPFPAGRPPLASVRGNQPRHAKPSTCKVHLGWVAGLQPTGRRN
jgi:hypothetical protein